MHLESLFVAVPLPHVARNNNVCLTWTGLVCRLNGSFIATISRAMRIEMTRVKPPVRAMICDDRLIFVLYCDRFCKPRAHTRYQRTPLLLNDTFIFLLCFS